MKIVVLDGQGGKIGRTLVEKLHAGRKAGMEIFAIGTNSAATSAMMKGGADYGATGENAVIANCRSADFIIGPVGIVIADGLFGEISPRMAVAVGQSPAERLLIPVNRCKTQVAGLGGLTLSALLQAAVDEILSKI